jgi:hypothetical protein
MKPGLLRALAAACVLPAACFAFGPEASVSVVIPAPPEHWIRAFPDLGFLVVFLDAQGRDREVEAADWRTPVSVSCSKAGNTPVLAFPRTSRDAGLLNGARGILRPAGGLYPVSPGASSAEATLELTWEDGAVAYVVSRLISIGRDASLFNAARLADFLRRSADPWKLDLDGIAQKVAQGSFNVYDIDALPGRDVTVKPGVGQWFLESPFCLVMTAQADGTLTLVNLAQGMHGLFSVNGHRDRIDVSPGGAVVTLF